MGKTFGEIAPDLRAWLEAQRLFFVATAPLAADGLVNCSPKGLDSFRVLGPREVAYLDLTGSGIETLAHLRENGRITLMFCAFTGSPRIVRLQGRGEAVVPEDDAWPSLRGAFPDLAGARAIIRVRVDRIADSCGYGVPRYEYVDDRDTLPRWAESKGPEAVRAYQREKNAASLDGLPGLSFDELLP
ncbi:MAG: pyridoxamine 5'-phosphate oxidase family protein [Planctomycetota bacterium]